MFNLKVIDTDEFLDMPPTTQNLYFHLNMRADDDGFVSSPKKIMKIINSADDDMKVLIAKQFIIPFESGVCVIKHWHIHNLIRGDRYTETEYKNEKKSLKLEDKKYSINDDKQNVIPDGNQMTAQVRLGKDRLDNTMVEKFEKFWELYPRKVSKKTALKSWSKINPQYFETIIGALKEYIKSDQWTKDNGQFIPHPSTWLNQERWNDDILPPAPKIKNEIDLGGGLIAIRKFGVWVNKNNQNIRIDLHQYPQLTKL